MLVGILKLCKAPKTSIAASDLIIGTDMEERVFARSFTVMLELDLDDTIRIRGRIKMKNLGPKYLQWAISVSDFLENEFGWSLSLGRMIPQVGTISRLKPL